MPPSGSDADGRLRRHAMGADNARRLLMTVMGEFVLPAGGMAWTSTFIEVLSPMGLEPGTIRQAIARTASAGWLEPERIGRRTRWRLTSAGKQLLVEGTKRIYDFAGPSLDWDGRWLVVLASVPETDRSGRHILRTRLSWAGMGSPAPGVWVGTQVSRLGEVEAALQEGRVTQTAQVFVAEHSGATPAGVMVAQAWDLAAIEAEYEGFIAEFSSRPRVEPLTRVIELVHAWRRFPWRDPALPIELLPVPWKGAEAATLFFERHERWSGAAQSEWARISDEA